MTEMLTPVQGAAAVSEEDGARAQVYALLGALLGGPPRDELLQVLRQLEAAEQGDGDGEMTAAWATLRQAAERADPGGLGDEYQDLFIGVGRGELMPYGSWYQTGFLMEKPLAELRVDLRRLGFEVKDGVREPEDHAAALCETMRLLAGSPEFSLDAQREFFDKHIDPWMARFFGDLTTARAASFYRAVGLLGQRFLEVERAYLSMLV